MVKEVSFGIIPVQESTFWKILLIQHYAGHWGFPKGHALPEELPEQTAERELFEETGLSVLVYLHSQPFIERYVFKREGQIVDKTVSYFLAKVCGTVHLLEEEVRSYRWTSFEEAMSLLTFEKSRLVLSQAILILDEPTTG